MGKMERLYEELRIAHGGYILHRAIPVIFNLCKMYDSDLDKVYDVMSAKSEYFNQRTVLDILKEGKATEVEIILEAIEKEAIEKEAIEKEAIKIEVAIDG